MLPPVGPVSINPLRPRPLPTTAKASLPSVQFKAASDDIPKSASLVFQLEGTIPPLKAWMPPIEQFEKQIHLLHQVPPAPCWRDKLKSFLKLPISVPVAAIAFPFYIFNTPYRRNLLHPMGFVTYFANSNEVFDELLRERHQLRQDKLTRELPFQHIQKGQIAPALASIQKAFKLNKDLEELEELYVLLGDFCKDIVSDLKRVKYLSGGDNYNLPEAHKETIKASGIPLASIAENAYRRAMALSPLSKEVDADHTNPGLWHLAELYELLNQPEKALKTWEEIVTHTEKNTPQLRTTAVTLLIQAYTRYGHLDKAIPHSLQLMERHPNEQATTLHQLYLLKANKDPSIPNKNAYAIQQVIVAFDALSLKNPSISMLEAYADFTRRHHQIPQALQLYRQLLEKVQQDPMGNIHLIRRYNNWILKLSAEEVTPR